MHIGDFQEFNKERSESPDGFNHKLGDWSTSDWFTALVGEVGEAANIVKKLNRYRDDIKGNRETIEELEDKLADEIADIYIYVDLLASHLGFDLENIIINKFNEVSERVGYRIVLE